MTMLDENVLSTALRGAADRIEVPPGAPERVLEASRVVTPKVRPPVRHHLRLPRSLSLPQNARIRTVLVAASVIVLLAGITVSIVKLDPGVARTNGSATSAGPAIGSEHVPAGDLPKATRAPFAPENGAATGAGAGAAQSGSSGSGSGSGQGAPNSVPPLPSGSVGQSAKVVSNGSISLTIGDGTLQSSLAKLTALASGEGGFVSSSQAQSGGGSATPSSGTVVLRVPEASFGATVTQVQQIGHVTSATTSANDVTGQYVDLQARISALQASRQQYLTILGQASSIGDILAVQSQIDTLQSQIEQLQGQLSVLTNETTYGTLTVSLAEVGKHPIRPPVPANTGLSRAWHDGIHGFTSGVEWLIRIGGTLLFVLLCLAALALLGRWGWRVARRRMI
jgi:hypothetical protein